MRDRNGCCELTFKLARPEVEFLTACCWWMGLSC